MFLSPRASLFFAVHSRAFTSNDVCILHTNCVDTDLYLQRLMHFTKPAWVIHKDSAKGDTNPKRLSIFSVHVHPDGSRIATGGLDAKIRIWSTKPILNQSSEESGKPPKSLCTLTMHTGPVLTVRWAYSGRWLASGSDDEIVMIWDLDPWVLPSFVEFVGWC